MSDALETNTLQDFLSVERIVADFNPNSAALKGNANIGAIGAGVGIVKDFLGTAGAAGTLTGPIGIFAGIFSLANQLIPKPTDNTVDLKIGVQDQLATSLKTTQSLLAKFNAALFGGPPESSFDFDGIVNAATADKSMPADVTESIAKVFANGDFLTAPAATDLERQFTKGLSSTKQGLAVVTLANQGYFVWIDLSISDPNACRETGSRWMQSVSTVC